MQTRSSSGQSSSELEGNIVDPLIELPTSGRSGCDWKREDEATLIKFLVDHTASSGDGNSFRSPVWNTAAQHLAKTHITGASKTSKACSEKWTRVRSTSF